MKFVTLLKLFLDVRWEERGLPRCLLRLKLKTIVDFAQEYGFKDIFAKTSSF